jgi:hypothetical protein
MALTSTLVFSGLFDPSEVAIMVCKFKLEQARALFSVQVSNMSSSSNEVSILQFLADSIQASFRYR